MDSKQFEAWAALVRKKHEIEAELLIAERLLEVGAVAESATMPDDKIEISQREPEPWDDNELMLESEVFQVAGAKEWRTLEKWIASDYFPDYYEIGGKTGRTRMWLAADVYRWQKWRDEKGCRRSYQTWMNSKDPEETGFE